MDNLEHSDHHQPTRAVAAGEEEGPDTFYLIPHSHWEGAMFLTREGYLLENGLQKKGIAI